MRQLKREVKIGNVTIGGKNPIAVQTMLNVPEIKALLRAALTEKINDREVYMKGIDASYHYEGYHVFKTEDLT